MSRDWLLECSCLTENLKICFDSENYRVGDDLRLQQASTNQDRLGQYVGDASGNLLLIGPTVPQSES
jgi:hypothetical protein